MGMRMSWIGVMFALLAACAWAQDQPAERPETDTTESNRQPAATTGSRYVELPGLKLDRQEKVLDVQATVIRREGDWLELLACTPGTREHEAVLTVQARPSHINLALIMMGLEPGSPRTAVLEDGKYKPVPARGDKVAVTLVTVDDEGNEKEVPANEWIFNRETEKPMEGNIWMFTGSSMYEHEGQQIFLADVNGTVLSLVHFGDDLLARDTELTSRSDGEILAANTKAIPEVGTKVRIRMRPADKKEDKDGKPAAPANDSAPGQ